MATTDVMNTIRVSLCHVLLSMHMSIQTTFILCMSFSTVTLHSTRMFTGFLIQARVPVPGIPFHMYRIVGTFVPASPEVRTLQCNATVDSPTNRPQQVIKFIVSHSITLCSKSCLPLSTAHRIQPLTQVLLLSKMLLSTGKHQSSSLHLETSNSSVCISLYKYINIAT